MEQYLTPENMEKILTLLVKYGTQVALAIVCLVVGSWVINRIVNFFNRVLDKREMDPSLKIYLGKIVSVLLKVCLFISVASMVGIQTTSFVALLGAAGLAVGMALQGSLANFAGGVLILLFKPFKVGDYLMATGQEGAVFAIDIFCTTLLTVDNKKVIIPNGPLIGGNIVNVTAEPTRRVDLSVGIGYNDDISLAQKVLIEAAASDARVLSEPAAPFVGVTDYGDSSINLTYRIWCKTSDYWDVYFDFNKKIKEVLDANKISIPYPQREVHTIDSPS